MANETTKRTLNQYLALPGNKQADLARDLQTSPTVISEMIRAGRGDSIFIEEAPDGSVSAYEWKPVPRRRKQEPA